VADVHDAEVALVLQGRILGHEIGPGAVDRLAVHRHRVRQVPGDRPGLGVAVGAAAVRQDDPLDAAREVGGPGDVVDVLAADPLDGPELRGQVGVPAERLEDAVGELRIAVLDLRAHRPAALGQSVSPSRSTPNRARKVPPPFITCSWVL
jgi:hypothetical protein